MLFADSVSLLCIGTFLPVLHFWYVSVFWFGYLLAITLFQFHLTLVVLHGLLYAHGLTWLK